ncbi:TetR/AcrR family transcriptional regulator [Actinomycetospora atypica]|uniref:TetR/AcrR family transcriptional regulator n=1 Tax=Actinomycetospora atypica TaxID=1290095 RepID=A0ABV9YT77_9PSEU
MKVSRRQADRNRDAVLRAASAMFRERGVEATSVAEIYHRVGLTHGGLYAQFPGGKETLAAEAIGHAFVERRDAWEDLARTHSPAECLRVIVENYVSAAHRDDPATGCPTPSIGAEAGRHDGPVRAAYTGGVRELLDSLSHVAPGDSEPERRTAALRILSTLTGAMLISRAVDDPALADEILGAIDPAIT